tara:strand:- start:1944 stop:3605 length:1662 start_codon:yes stop_codon:yes gene_type:complete
MAGRDEREFSTQAPAGYVGDFLQQGIFPYAQGFLDDQFQNLGSPDSSPFTYTGQRVADFDPREQYAMDMSDQAIGSYRPYLQDQGRLLNEAGAVSRGGTAEGQGLMRAGVDAGAGFTGEAANLARGARPQYGQAENLINASMGNYGEVQNLLRTGAPNLDLARRETAAARPDFGSARAGLSRAEQSGRGSTGMYDPSSAQSFYNPYEDQVVQQTLKDIREGLATGDMGLRDEAVTGGAFGGSRSRLRRNELAENTARGAAEQIGALRNQGFTQAQAQAQQAFEAQQGRQAGFAGQQAGLAGQRGSLAGAEGQAALSRGSQFGNLSSTEAANQLSRAQGLAGVQGSAAGQRFQAGQGLAGLQTAGAANQLARSQQLGGLGQQTYGMGMGAGQGIAGLGTQLGQNLSGYGQSTGAMGAQLAGLQGADINRTMGMGGLNRGREQSEMDLAYQNFTGQYNLPMQTLQNVGSLTASLAPIAGGYGYAGSSAPTDYGAVGAAYMPNQGGIGAPGGNMGATAGGNMGGNTGTIPGGMFATTQAANFPQNYNTYGGNMPVA